MKFEFLNNFKVKQATRSHRGDLPFKIELRLLDVIMRVSQDLELFKVGQGLVGNGRQPIDVQSEVS
jgi:hypothetical protein